MTEDEHPNERLVTPSEDGEGFDRSLVSRRQMIGGSALLAGLLAYTSDPTQPTNPNVGIAAASHNPDEPLIILGPESDPIGYLFQDTVGGIILQDATSGNHFWYNESEGRWETDAELDVPTLTADDLDIGTADLVSSGDWFGAGPSQSQMEQISTTSTSYVSDVEAAVLYLVWDDWLPTDAQASVIASFRVQNSDGDVRLRNSVDNDNVFEQTDTGIGFNRVGPTNYSPSTTGSVVAIRYEVRTNDGGSATNLNVANQSWGVQV